MSLSYMDVGGEYEDSSVSKEELLAGSRFPDEMQSESNLTMGSNTLLTLASARIPAEGPANERSTVLTHRTSKEDR
jgi:hypothetical protein